MKKKLIYCLSLFIVIACKKEQELTFIEINNTYKDVANVEINIPNAEGNGDLGNIVNSTLENHIANMLLFEEKQVSEITINEAAKKFNDEAVRFREEFEESNVIFEAQFDGEVSYQSAKIISIAITAYLNTGGAHGNTNITFYNFDVQTGDVLELKEMVSDENSFTVLAKTYFEKAVDADTTKDLSDYFFGEQYHLPTNIGYSEDGLLLIYNQYEIASYATGITEYKIPYSELNEILLKH